MLRSGRASTIEDAEEENTPKTVEKRPLRPPYRLDQTALHIGSELTVLRTSESLGWPNINVSLVREQPHNYEIAHRAIPDLWIATSYSPLDVVLNVGGREQRYVVPSGRIWLLAPETPLGLRRAKERYGLNAFLKSEILAEVAGEMFNRDARSVEFISAFGEEDQSLTILLDLLNQALSEPGEHSSLKIEYLSRALAVDVLSKHVTSKRAPPMNAGERLTTKQARLVTEYIHEHISSEILLNDLATLAGLSRTLFVQRFKVSFKQTPHRYLMEARVRRSQGLLAKTSLPTSQIALMCGFADQSHFSASFKRAVGVSPSVYRKYSRA